ncbi:hypothetical protein HN873_000016 [Arachis hypogaea]
MWSLCKPALQGCNLCKLFRKVCELLFQLPAEIHSTIPNKNSRGWKNNESQIELLNQGFEMVGKNPNEPYGEKKDTKTPNAAIPIPLILIPQKEFTCTAAPSSSSWLLLAPWLLARDRRHCSSVVSVVCVLYSARLVGCLCLLPLCSVGQVRECQWRMTSSSSKAEDPWKWNVAMVELFSQAQTDYADEGELSERADDPLEQRRSRKRTCNLSETYTRYF